MGHVDRGRPPQGGKPWTAIAAHDFIHKIDLVAPQDCYPALCQKLVEQNRQPVYARVTMALGQLVQGEFFTECIKKGDVTMLSQGRTSTDNVFSLRKGMLKIYLDKETFERAGLPGKPYGAKGGRGLKPRWVVSYDLASSACVHGKRGFDRLLYACKQVFHEPVTWLLYDADPATPSLKTLEAYKPANFTVEVTTIQNQEVSEVTLEIPAATLADGDRPGLEETATELYEWLSLIRLQSPRVDFSDSVDPFLSRYSASSGTHDRTQVCLLSWQGFFAASWLRALVMDALEACPPQQWISISATTYSTSVAGLGSELMLLRPSGAANEYLMWETASAD